MTIRTLKGAAWLVVCLWAIASFTDTGKAIVHAPELYPAIVDADCGAKPPYDKSHVDAWYTYGDCSGDYGPIDGAE